MPLLRGGSAVLLGPVGVVRGPRHSGYLDNLQVRTKAQTTQSQHFLDLLERLAAESRSLQQFVLGPLCQVANAADVLGLQALQGADREFQLVDRAEEERIQHGATRIAVALVLIACPDCGDDDGSDPVARADAKVPRPPGQANAESPRAVAASAGAVRSIASLQEPVVIHSHELIVLSH